MTKKDYKLIANAIWRSDWALRLKDSDRANIKARAVMKNLIVTDLAASLKDDNPRFDSGKFREACGVSAL